MIKLIVFLFIFSIAFQVPCEEIYTIDTSLCKPFHLITPTPYDTIFIDTNLPSNLITFTWSKCPVRVI
jgi:hypothetical protein